MAEEKPSNEAQEEDQANNGQKTPFEQFDDLMTKLLTVPKEELDEQRAEYAREKKEKRGG